MTPRDQSELADKSIEEILDTIGDKYARDVLAEICRKEQSAKELDDVLDYSLQTIYRRLEMLQKYDLVISQTQIARDGNHYEIYRSNFESALISVDGDQYDVRIYRKENLPNQFITLWNELGKND